MHLNTVSNLEIIAFNSYKLKQFIFLIFLYLNKHRLTALHTWSVLLEVWLALAIG